MYKSSSKRKSHILKNHPGKEPPPSARDKAVLQALGNKTETDDPLFNPTFSTTVGSVTSQPHNCRYCHKQYATNAKLLQHLRKDHKTPDTSPPCFVTEVGQLVQGQQQPTQPLKIEEQWPREDQPCPQDEIIASAGLQEGPSSHNIAYRIDGEVLQLTRVPQDEAMRLVNSGATVIHVASDDDPLSVPPPGPSSRMTTSHLQSNSQPSQPSFQPRSNRGLNGYDLPAELVQVLVSPEEAAAAASTSSGRPRTNAQPQNETPPSSQHQDWINAYRR